jgi:hypothetical protein
MTRKVLAAHNGERSSYRGRFERFGVVPSSQGRRVTLVLCDIVDSNGAPVCDHIWLNLTLALRALDLFPGDIIQFDGRVEAYHKRGQRKDYKLTRPTHVSKVYDAKAALLGANHV